MFAFAAALGLGNSADNIDALELLVCDDYEDCAEDHGIRAASDESTNEDGSDDDDSDDDDSDDDDSDDDDSDDDELGSGDDAPQIRWERD